MRPILASMLSAIVLTACAYAAPDDKPAVPPPPPKTMKASPYQQEVRTIYTASEGVAEPDVRTVAVTEGGHVYAGTAKGLLHFSAGKWTPVNGLESAPISALTANGAKILAATGDGLFAADASGAQKIAPWPDVLKDPASVRSLSADKSTLVASGAGLFRLDGQSLTLDSQLDPLLGTNKQVKQVATGPDGVNAVAAAAGLFMQRPGAAWEAVYPSEGARSWAPRDVRGVAFDRAGRLWFASPQGVGCLDKEWKLFTGYEGLPYDDFTTVAPGEDGVVWFGTRLGAIRYDGSNWEYRQGLRWIPDDDVRAIAVTPEGHAWFATAKGVGVIERRKMTLAEKATFFEEEIDKYHRRTPYGYVDSVSLDAPNDKSHWTQHDSDNDGLWTGMYGAGECFAYAATKSPEAKSRAKAVFEALRFLGAVTQGGTPPAQPGFVARSILPTSGRNPNEGRVDEDQQKQQRDRLWKVMDPRWPKSADGQWYWKSDTSSDELDGHFFFYAQYYDFVADTDQEKQRVRDHVLGIVDHLVAHDFDLIDFDGKPTRWARYNPAMFDDPQGWWGQRGLNSLEILSYLKVAEHISGGSPKYRQAYDLLRQKHGYALNVMNPKPVLGPGLGNQSDDEMAFMCFYNLLHYEEDTAQKRMYARAWMSYWMSEEPERNPLFDFLFAARCNEPGGRGLFRIGPYGTWLEDSVDSLQRYPLDRVHWAMKNSHRKDIAPLSLAAQVAGRRGTRGWLHSGKVLPIDERFVDKWNHDPWSLDTGGDGRELADGASFLLPYYMGLYHGFITE